MTTGKKNLVSALLISSALFAFWRLDVYGYRKIVVLKKAAQERQDLLNSRTKTLDQIAKIYDEYQRRAGDVEQLSSGLPDKKDVAEIVSAMDRLATGSGVQLSGIAISEEHEDIQQGKKTSSVGKISLSTQGKSSYQGLLAFFEGIEKNIRLFDIESLSIDVNESQANTLGFNMRARAYFIGK